MRPRIALPIGFIRRGCQAKILFFREEGMFFRHSAPIYSCTNPGQGAVCKATPATESEHGRFEEWIE